MWRNLGRVIAEYPHLNKYRAFPKSKYIEIVGDSHLSLMKNLPKGALMFTGHIGNWEISGIPIIQYGIPMAFVYRAPNNPYVDYILRRTRSKNITSNGIPKGAVGARKIVEQVKRNGYTAMLIDQKMNDGVSIPFFGSEAMTAPALAQLAIKYDLPIFPVRVERLKGCNFRTTIYPELEITNTGNIEQDIVSIMTQVNLILEEWIRERPAEWLWIHNRWPKGNTRS
jgi:KDO2-lipid IV(A) lauroyltransferase